MNAIPPRRRILDAALELFNRNGYAATSQAEIAGAAGIRQGNLTYHFPAKLDLVAALRDEARALVAKSINPRVHRKQKRAAVKLAGEQRGESLQLELLLEQLKGRLCQQAANRDIGEERIGRGIRLCAMARNGSRAGRGVRRVWQQQRAQILPLAPGQLQAFIEQLG